jgi:hypothetical protein
MNSEEFKPYFEIAKPFIQPVISTVLKPQLSKLTKWLKKNATDNKVIESFYEDKFAQYLGRTHKSSSIINTLVFPNQQIKIKDIYFPLTIVSTKDYKQFEINEKPNAELFSTFKRILISDYAGMGKSTLMRWVSLNLIENPSTIPILIELRKLDKGNKILDEIFQLIDPIDKNFDKDLIIRFLELGFFTIILDGFDEIPKDIQETVTGELREFVNKVPDNNFILTSRPESALSSFGDFQMFYIKQLEPKQSYEIIKKYDALNNIKYAENLIGEIKSRLDQVKEFLTNPFLVSLLYKSYTYNKDIPSKKTTFYEEVYSSLFKHHDSSKDGYKREKISKLDILDFRIVLRHLAFETSKLGKVIYSESELVNFITSAKTKTININFKESDYLDDLLTTVPLFVRDGSQIKWAHKSIQDYFAAEYITFHTKKEEILRRIYASEKDNYLNIIDLTYELEPKLFRKIILLPLLSDFVSHCDTTYLECTEIPAELLNDRKCKTFGVTFCIINCNNDIGFEKATELFKDAVNETASDFYSGGTHLGGSHIFIMSSRVFKSQLINILGSKNEDLFENVGWASRNHENIKKLPPEVAFVVTDDAASPLNSIELFLEVNCLLYHRLESRRNRAYVLNYGKARATIDRIEMEIKIDESNDDLKDI